jgi:two-component system NtrC family sensor kinase
MSAKNNPVKKLSLAGRLSVMVFLLGLLVYIPSSLYGAYNSLKQTKADLEDYKNRLEMRVRTAFEPAIWNYDIETLRKLINAELGNENLKSVKVSTDDSTLIWITSVNKKTYDEMTEPKGVYLDKHIIPIHRIDEPSQIIGYATVWFDNEPSRNKFFRMFVTDVLVVGGILLVISVAVNISSYIKLVRPIESIRNSMIEAGKSALMHAREKIEKASFDKAFPEIKRMAADLENMLNDIEKAHRKVRESEAQFKAIFEQAGVGVAQVDAVNNKYIIVNQRYCDIVGCTQDEIKGLSLRTITYKDDVPVQLKLTDDLVSGKVSGFSFEKRYVHKDGKIVWTELTASPLWAPDEKPTSYIAVIQDITARKTAEEKLRKLNEELELKIFERTQDLENANCELEAAIEDLKTAQDRLIISEKMAVLGQLVAGIAHELNTPLGIIKSAGGTMERVLQDEIEKVIGFCYRTSEEVFETYLRLVRECCKGEEKDNAYKRNIRKMYYSILEKNNLVASDEFIEKLVDIGYEADETEFSELVRNPENEEAVKMAYTVISMQKSAKMIKVSAEKASKVITALKLYAHKDTVGVLVPHDVIKDIEMVLTLYYNQIKYGVEIFRNYEEVPPVLCYPDKLHQVWVNIINNALQAMDYKGRLIIRVSKNQDKVLVSITDNGPGIPEHIRHRIFEPFFTTKKLGEGTGLGLDIVKRILDEINGSIEFDSKPGETTFKIWLRT